jgi:hypothetical protein
MGGTCNKYREDERFIWVLMGKHEGRRGLRRTRSRLEDNIKMDLQVVGWEHELD